MNAKNKSLNFLKKYLKKLWFFLKKNCKFFTIVFIFFIISIFIESQEENFIENRLCCTHALANVLHHLTQFLWLELIGGWFVWYFLEDSVKKYLDVPRDIDGKNYKMIASKIRRSNGNVFIFDNDINPYFIGIHSSDKLDKLNKNLTQKNIEIASINLKESMELFLGQDGSKEIKILLLHPESHAAEQRSQDLKKLSYNERYDMYSEMKEGLGRLYLMLEEFESKEILENGDIVANNKQKKPEVKLFRASQAANFVVFDDEMIFSLIKSTSVTDKQNFQINKFSPLAKSFIDNFNSLFKSESTTMDFYDYMRVTLSDGARKEEINNLIWGPDSGNHHVPVYICISCREKKLMEERTSGRSLILKHNREISWISIKKIDEQDKKNREFAINRILNNYFSTFGQDSDEWVKKYDSVNGMEVYKILPNHKNKIRLEQGNYVKKHLNERGYCYTPSTMYDVYLGLTLNKILPSIYDVFTKFDKNNLSNYSFYKHETKSIGNNKKVRVPNRIIWSFFCEVEDSEIRVGEYNEADKYKFSLSKNNELWTKLNRYCFANRELVKDKDIHNCKTKPDVLKRAKYFVISTIKADIDFILGKYSEQINDGLRSNVQRFLVHVHFIRGEVFNDNLELDFQADGYVENNADFTVIHSLGKKNITGGFSELWIGDEVIRKYNFSNPLDSLYFSKSFKAKKIKLTSNNVSFSSFEAEQNMKKDGERNKIMNRDSNDDNKTKYNKGFRNLICLEFIELNALIQKQN